MRPKPLGPLTLNEAVETWVLMLGLAGADDVGGRPGLVLPSYTVNSITETLWSYDARDRLTLVLAFNQLVQRLMVAVGRTIESAIETEAHSKNGMVEVEVEEAAMIQVFVGDTNEDFDSMTLMMKGLNYQANKYTDEEWTGCLQNLRQAFEVQTKGAQRAIARLLLRRLRHRTTDNRTGYLLGHATGRAANWL